MLYRRRMLPNRITDFEMKCSFSVNIPTVETKLAEMAITQGNGSDRWLEEIFVRLKQPRQCAKSTSLIVSWHSTLLSAGTERRKKIFNIAKYHGNTM